MLDAVLLLIALAPPAPEPGATSDHWEVGPLRLDQRSALVWPHAFVPSFTLVPERRRVHSLTLGLDLPALHGLAFDAVLVEPSSDPGLRARTAGMPTGEGTAAYGWVGARARIPGSAWQLQVGRSFIAGAAGAFVRRGGGGWRVSLLRRF